MCIYVPGIDRWRGYYCGRTHVWMFKGIDDYDEGHSLMIS